MKSIQIPDDVYKRAAELAAADNVSVERFVAAIVNERASDWARLQARGARGSLDKLHRVLAKVADAPPDPADCL